MFGAIRRGLQQWRNGTVAILRARLERYLRIAIWLFHDGVLRFWRHALQVVVFGALAVSGQIAAILIITHMAETLQSGAAVWLLHWQVEPRSLGSLAVVLGSIGVALLVAAFADFLARRKMITLMGAYGRFCRNRLIACESRRPPRKGPRTNGASPDRKRAPALLQDAGSVAMVMKQYLLTVVPLFQIIGFGAALCYLSPETFALICLLVAAALVLYYTQSVAGAKCSLAVEKLAKAANKDQLGIMKSLRRSRLPIALEEDQIDKALDQGASKALDNARLRRDRVMLHTELTTKLVSTLAIVAAIAILGGRAIEENSGWVMLIVYIIALRYWFGGVRAVAVGISAANRMYPQVSRYVALIQGAEGEFARREGQRAGALGLGAAPLPESGEDAKGAPTGDVSQARLVKAGD